MQSLICVHAPFNQDAIRNERYGEAAQVKAAISALEAQDAVALVQRQLRAALSEERYSDAADLRDSGLTGLQGWWAGQAEDDPVGHIMHITPEFSRSGNHDWKDHSAHPRHYY